MGAIASTALGDEAVVELLDETEPRQTEVDSPSFFESDVHILDEVFDVEARLRSSKRKGLIFVNGKKIYFEVSVEHSRSENVPSS